MGALRRTYPRPFYQGDCRFGSFWKDGDGVWQEKLTNLAGFSHLLM